MHLLFEDPDFDVFDLDNFDLGDLVKDNYTLLNIGRAMMLDMAGVECYNPEYDTYIEDDDIIVVQHLRHLYFLMSLSILHPHIIEMVYARPIKCFQALFKIYKDHIIKPCEIRVNKDVRGKILGSFEIDVTEEIKPECVYNAVFVPCKEDKKYSHITVIFNDEETFSIYCYLKLKNKEYGNYLDSLIPYTYLNERQFLEYAKDKGCPVSSKTLRNYRSKGHQRIFPMPLLSRDPISGLMKKYYDKTWIKYLKRIKELKEILKDNQELYLKYGVKRLRDLDKHLGFDSFKNI